jgi:hypothetical protein
MRRTVLLGLMVVCALAWPASAMSAGKSPRATFTVSPAAPETGQEITFDASASTCWGSGGWLASNCATYAWADDGDATDPLDDPQWPLGSGKVLNFAFQGAGTKWVWLTLTDSAGRRTQTMTPVVVSNPPPPPPPSPACSDGIDNDGDSLIDYPNDPGCSSATDIDETDVAAGTRTFDATYETAIVPPWGSIQDCAPTTAFTRDSTHVFAGSWGAKAYVNGTCGFGSQRAEVLNTSGATNQYTEGEEAYFADSAYFASDFPTTQEGHCLFNQIHSEQRGQQGMSPAYATNCRKPAVEPHDVELRPSGGGCVYQTALPRDTWLHFVIRMKFSTSTATGSYDVWYGTGSWPVTYTKVIDNCAIAALLSSTDYGYFKVGYYRGLNNTVAASIWHDDSRVGTTFASVAQQ